LHNRRSFGFLFTTAAALLLVGAVVLQVSFRLREVPQGVTRARLAAILPKDVEGWAAAEESLGATESINEATLKALNLDDYVYRRFRRGTVSFTVYAAYWAPGRMPTRLVASHTPDRCWTENGMRCVDMQFRQSNRIGTETLLPAEYRVFTAGGKPPQVSVDRLSVIGDRAKVQIPGSVVQSGATSTNNSQPIADNYHPRSTGAPRTYVLYWHTVEGKLYDYGERFNAIPHPWLWWKDTLAQAAYGSREQLFVRIASETSFEILWQETGFQTVMKSVADLGLWAPPR
jgi:hypothetical protein